MISATRMMDDSSSRMTDSISTRLNAGSTDGNLRVTDSTMTTRNGKGMGSGSGRPLPSTHLGDGVRFHQSKDDGVNFASMVDMTDDGRNHSQIRDQGNRWPDDGVKDHRLGHNDGTDQRQRRMDGARDH